MTNKIKRTDQCPCNSGKLFKECHMRVYKPTEDFIVRPKSGTKASDFHMEKKEGSDEWEKVPGRMSVMLGYTEKDYDEIDVMIRNVKECIPEDRYVLSERLSRLKHKLYGIRYHMENFTNEESKIIARYTNDYNAPATTSFYQNPSLIYEIEAFLFQIKSALDVYAQLIAMTFDLNGINTYSTSARGNKIVKKLNESKKYGFIGGDLAKRLKDADDWIRDAVDMRDEVTHYSNLQGFMCFVEQAWDGGEYARISYPYMPDGPRASTYMNETYRNLWQLLFDSSAYIMTKLKLKN